MSTPQSPKPTEPVSGANPAAGGPAAAPRPAAGAPGAPTQPQPHGPGVVKRTTNTVKRFTLVIIGALIALFAVLNTDQTEVDWIFGTPVQTPLILVIAVAFLAGAIIGWLVAKLSGRGNTAS